MQNLYFLIAFLCLVLLSVIPSINGVTKSDFFYFYIPTVVGVLVIAALPECIRSVQLKKLCEKYKLNFRSNFSLRKGREEDQMKLHIISGVINGHQIEIFDDLNVVGSSGFVLHGNRTRVFLDGRFYKDIYGVWYAPIRGINKIIQEVGGSGVAGR
ncbi:MAG TPA: hypothetical protein VLB83_03785 [Candidatus Paceibacterota bacterium]|nr:hypothetical protein [Candidatus Paceibacterota bacterium]